MQYAKIHHTAYYVIHTHNSSVPCSSSADWYTHTDLTSLNHPPSVFQWNSSVRRPKRDLRGATVLHRPLLQVAHRERQRVDWDLFLSDTLTVWWIICQAIWEDAQTHRIDCHLHERHTHTQIALVLFCFFPPLLYAPERNTQRKLSLCVKLELVSQTLVTCFSVGQSQGDSRRALWWLPRLLHILYFLYS